MGSDASDANDAKGAIDAIEAMVSRTAGTLAGGYVVKRWLGLTLGIMTATGGFLDAGTIATAAQAGKLFNLGLVWAILVATVALIMLVEMSGRLAAVAHKPYAALVRERLGFRFYLLPLVSEMIAESLLLAAELGGVAIALSLFTGINWHILFPVAVVLVWVLCWRGPFALIENGPAILGLVTLSFFVGIARLGGPSPALLTTLWRPMLGRGQLAPYLYLVAATLGATISPYLLYFYSSGAREEHWSVRSLPLNRVTAIVGMSFGALGSIALVVLGAMVLRPLALGAGTLGQVDLAMARPLGTLGTLLFATVLFATCLGAALEVSLAISYNIAQGFGWEWGEDKPPARTARFKLVFTVFLLVGFIIGLLSMDPLKLALLASTVIALFLPISLAPLLVLMNDRTYLGDRTNGRASNIFLIGILVMAFVVALVSLPLLFLSGGG